MIRMPSIIRRLLSENNVNIIQLHYKVLDINFFFVKPIITYTVLINNCRPINSDNKLFHESI